jgi:DNA-binding GntR family transcriptional regulator
MIMSLDREDVPKYLQLAGIIRAQIISGELEPRRAAPSELYLSQHYGIARDTVRKATALLREEGYIYVVKGLGAFVSPAEDWPAKPRD